MYERFKLEGTWKVVWFSLPACSYRAQGQINIYQKSVLSSIYLHTVNNIQPFSSGFNLSLRPPVYTPCLLDEAWLRSPALWYHHPVFRHSSSSLACLLCLAMWYFPPKSWSNKKGLYQMLCRCQAHTLGLLFFSAYQKPNKSLCFINYPGSQRLKEKKRYCWSAWLRSLIWKVILEKHILTSS